MDPVFSSVIGMGVFILATAATGKFLGDKGRPYRAFPLTVHIILFAFLLAGVVAPIYKLEEVAQGKMYSSAAFYIAGLAVLLSCVSGLMLAKGKEAKADPKVVLGHKIFLLLLLLSIIAEAVFHKLNI